MLGWLKTADVSWNDSKRSKSWKYYLLYNIVYVGPSSSNSTDSAIWQRFKDRNFTYNRLDYVFFSWSSLELLHEALFCNFLCCTAAPVPYLVTNRNTLILHEHKIDHGKIFNPISAGGGGGGGIHPPPGFSLAIATKINRSTPNFLTFNFYYRDIIWPKIKVITCQGVMWSLFCRKHFVSPHIFHCIFTEFSCSIFSFSDIYIQC